MAVVTGLAWRVQEPLGIALNDETLDPNHIGDNECLVKIEAAALNYRDIMIVQGTYPFDCEKGVVLGCDGAGTVVAVGKKVTTLKPGSRVYTLSHQGYLAGWLDERASKTSLGGNVDGTFRKYGFFSELGLVPIPEHLTFREAATLGAAGVTAWNALYGLPGVAPKAGDTVVTQGTGGVSIFAAQFALAAGATVIATTSNAEKAAILKGLGVHHVINYREQSNWGAIARQLTPEGQGVDFVVEVGGSLTHEQSLAAIRRGGVIALCGAIAGFDGAETGPPLLRAWTSSCIARGVAVGSRLQALEMGKAIAATGLRPVLDPKVFALGELKEALQYLEEQKHFGKVVVDC